MKTKPNDAQGSDAIFATIVVTVGAILILVAILAGMALLPAPHFGGPSLAYTSGPDADADGITDNHDNCPFMPNPDQRDTNHDGRGDVCVMCPKALTPEQADFSRHGAGDLCDPDGDGISNILDNCPGIYNPDQADVSPGDRRGNACS